MNTFKAMREKCGLTQEELAQRLNLDRTTVSKWDLGIATPRPKTLRKLADIFGCTVDELLN